MPTSAAKRSEPRDRLLRTAGGLFYAKGIRAVGVEELLERAGVTRATLYRHFDGKDDLVATYLRTADEQMRERFAAVRAEDAPPGDRIRSVARLLGDQITSRGFRGCAFLNAAAEYPDGASPAHRAVLAQRGWLLEEMTSMFADAGAPEPRSAAQHFVMLRDGAMAAGCLGDARQVADVLFHGVDRMLVMMGDTPA